jgi:MFS family permease
MTFALSGISQTVNIFVAKLGWTESETVLYNTLINSASIIGITIGAVFGGQVIRIGRRKANFIANFMVLIGCALQMHLSVPTLMIGRFINGLTAGICAVISTKCYGENIPGELASVYGLLYNAFVCIGFPLSYGLGFILPTE